MCGSKKGGKAATPAQPVSAQPVAAATSVKTAIKETDKARGSNPDLRTDANTGVDIGGPTDINLPSTGEVSLGAKKKRKGVVGLDL